MAATGRPRIQRISAMPTAREAITRLRAARGGSVMFVQSAGQDSECAWTVKVKSGS